MISRSPKKCPNCAATYAPNAHFCTSCGRSRDETPATEMVSASPPDANRSVMLQTQRLTVRQPAPMRQPSSPSPTPLSDETPFVLPKPGAGVIVGVVVLFFGLVWMGRTINGPKAPPAPAPAPIPFVKSVLTPTPQEEEQFQAKEKADLREAVSYSSGIRAEAASEFLQGAVRYSQDPPSAEPKPYQTITVYSGNSGGR